MYFNTKNYLKSNHNHIVKHALNYLQIFPLGTPFWFALTRQWPLQNTEKTIFCSSKKIFSKLDMIIITETRMYF